MLLCYIYSVHPSSWIYFVFDVFSQLKNQGQSATNQTELQIKWPSYDRQGNPVLVINKELKTEGSGVCKIIILTPNNATVSFIHIFAIVFQLLTLSLSISFCLSVSLSRSLSHTHTYTHMRVCVCARTYMCECKHACGDGFLFCFNFTENDPSEKYVMLTNNIPELSKLFRSHIYKWGLCSQELITSISHIRRPIFNLLICQENFLSLR